MSFIDNLAKKIKSLKNLLSKKNASPKTEEPKTLINTITEDPNKRLVALLFIKYFLVPLLAVVTLATVGWMALAALPWLIALGVIGSVAALISAMPGSERKPWLDRTLDKLSEKITMSLLKGFLEKITSAIKDRWKYLNDKIQSTKEEIAKSGPKATPATVTTSQQSNPPASTHSNILAQLSLAQEVKTKPTTPPQPVPEQKNNPGENSTTTGGNPYSEASQKIRQKAIKEQHKLLFSTFHTATEGDYEAFRKELSEDKTLLYLDTEGLGKERRSPIKELFGKNQQTRFMSILSTNAPIGELFSFCAIIGGNHSFFNAHKSRMKKRLSSMLQDKSLSSEFVKYLDSYNLEAKDKDTLLQNEDLTINLFKHYFIIKHKTREDRAKTIAESILDSIRKNNFDQVKITMATATLPEQPKRFGLFRR